MVRKDKLFSPPSLLTASPYPPMYAAGLICGPHTHSSPLTPDIHPGEYRTTPSRLSSPPCTRALPCRPCPPPRVCRGVDGRSRVGRLRVAVGGGRGREASATAWEGRLRPYELWRVGRDWGGEDALEGGNGYQGTDPS